MLRMLLLLLALLAPPPLLAVEAPEIVIADFEGEDYGGWTATGEAFGKAPARGTLPGQMAVSGFEGKGLVNSYLGGDRATGTLTSPPFRIERPYISFLIGGGKHPGETCIDLLIDGEVVRTATGPNDRPGGSERLDWHSWDVSELIGRQATLRIVDRQTGGWGHINVDQIVQGSRRRQLEPARREIVVEGRYLHLPVRHGGDKRRMKLVLDGATFREFEIVLADGPPDFQVFADLEGLRSRTLAIEVDRLPEGSQGLAAIVTSNELPDQANLYRERDRPQFHFTSRRGWLNDPNGLVFHRGEYHLFYQHNPYGWGWGNMHWGHAVSPDLVHWRELPVAIYPRQFGDWAYSGSAVVDSANTSGFGNGQDPPLVIAYTSTGRGECIAYSNDGGRTLVEYEGNPVVEHQGRDPRLLWHEPSKRWVMAVYDEHEGERAIAFYTSPDLKRWTFRSRIGGYYECPDLFELLMPGQRDESRWVLYGADGQYALGQFDGETFHPDGEDRHRLWYGDFYAAQTFSNVPEGRRVQIGWGRGIDFPAMPFNQQMTIAVDLSLRPTDAGPRLFGEPVAELARLRKKSHTKAAWTPTEGVTVLENVSGDLFDIEAELDPDGATEVGLVVQGTEVTYRPGPGELACGDVTAPLSSVNGRVRLRILVDRGSVEVFGNDGQVALSVGVIHPENQQGVAVFSRGGRGRWDSLKVHELGSIWNDDGDAASGSR